VTARPFSIGRLVLSTALGVISASAAQSGDVTPEVAAGVGCVALVDAIYVSNEELGRTAGGDQIAVHQEWMEVLGKLAPDLTQAEFDLAYADIYPNIYPTILAFGKEVMAGSQDELNPSDAARTFVQMNSFCREKMKQVLDMP
jgi:hypothetical protein